VCLRAAAMTSGHELPVHDVPLDEVDACGVEVDDRLPELREVDRQHRRGDADGAVHAAILGARALPPP